MNLKHTYMTSRTSITLQKDLLSKAKKIVREERLLSLSKLIQKSVEQYIDEYERLKRFKTMEKNYKAYAQSSLGSELKDLEEAALADYFRE